MANWRGAYERKIVPLEGALEKIPRGAVVYVSPGATLPVPLMDAILDVAAGKGWRLIIPWAFKSFPRERIARLREIGRPVTLLSLIGEQMALFKEGLVEYVPVGGLDLPRFSREIFPDASIVTVSLPDRFGYLSLGPSVDLTRCMVAASQVTVGIMNSAVPRTFGESLVPLDRFSFLVRHDFALPELPFPYRPAPEDESIAELVREVIPHGAVLDVRSGRIPPGLLRAVMGGKEITLRTEYVTDWVLDLFEEERSLDFQGDSPITTSFAMGSSRLYEFLHDNPSFHFVRIGALWNVRAGSVPFITLLGAHRVDLYGRILERSPGILPLMERLENLVFSRRSRHARSFVIMRSRDAEGRSSFEIPGRASPLLPAQYVDGVITEYGIAHLWGRSLKDRVIALISVAHPDDRARLMARAKSAGIIPVDTMVPMSHAGSSRMATLKDGSEVRIREAVESDRSMLVDLYWSLSEQDLRYRFFDGTGSVKEWCSTLDIAPHHGVVVVALEDGALRILGQAEYRLEEDGTGSVALAVRPDSRRKGVATQLISFLEDVARRHGVRRLTAAILTSNHPTVSLFRSLGWSEEQDGYDMVLFHRDLAG